MSALTELAEQIEGCKAEITNLASIVETMDHRISTLEAELQIGTAEQKPELPATAG